MLRHDIHAGTVYLYNNLVVTAIFTYYNKYTEKGHTLIECPTSGQITIARCDDMHYYPGSEAQILIQDLAKCQGEVFVLLSGMLANNKNELARYLRMYFRNNFSLTEDDCERSSDWVVERFKELIDEKNSE